MPLAPPPAQVFTFFENNGPVDSFMKFLFLPDTSPDPDEMTLFAVNINTTACFNIGVYDVISELTYLSIQLVTATGTLYTVNMNVTQRIDKGSYFYFRIQPVNIPITNDNLTNCSLTILEPSILNVGFYNSDYNATLSNANNIRTSDFIFDVDRVRDQNIPTNYDAIIQEIAVKAPVQDSNYSSIGHQRSKYVGSKTDINDYGLHSALGLVPFEGALYDQDKTPAAIVSQSYSEKPIDDYSFAARELSLFDQSLPSPNNQLVLSSTTTLQQESAILPKIEYRTVYKDTVTGVLEAGYSTHPYNNTTPGADPREALGICLTSGNVTERDERIEIFNNYIDEVLLLSYLYNTVQLVMYMRVVGTQAITVTDFNIYLEGIPYTNDVGSLSGFPSNAYKLPGGQAITIYKPFGDTIYNTETNRLFKITNRKLFVAESDKIYYIDSTGNLIHLEEA